MAQSLPTVPPGHVRVALLQGNRYWIECWDYSPGPSAGQVRRITPASLHRTGQARLHASGSTGLTLAGDEVRPLSPIGEFGFTGLPAHSNYAATPLSALAAASIARAWRIGQGNFSEQSRDRDQHISVRCRRSLAGFGDSGPSASARRRWSRGGRGICGSFRARGFSRRVLRRSRRRRRGCFRRRLVARFVRLS